MYVTSHCNVSRCTLAGTVRCPPSKSYTHRAIFMAALAETGGTTITNILRSADTDATIRACTEMGAKITISQEADGSTTATITDVIRTTHPRAGGARPTDGSGEDQMRSTAEHENDPIVIDAANSGTTIRIAAGVAALLERPVTLTGDQSLKKRPMQQLLDALARMGAARAASDSGHPPLDVRGPMAGGSAMIKGDVSSQFVTSLFVCAPKTPSGMEIAISGDMVSKPYLDATIRTMREFGVAVQTQIPYKRYRIESQRVRHMPRFAVPSDASSLALLLAASALNGGGVSIGAQMGTLPQGDEVFIEMLESMGATVHISDAAADCGGEAATASSAKRHAGDEDRSDMRRGGADAAACDDTASGAKDAGVTCGGAPAHGEIISMAMPAGKGGLRGGRFDLGNHPDLLPPLAIMALECGGPIEIFNVQHARLKETDRIAILSRELPKIGIAIEERADGMTVHAPDANTTSGTSSRTMLDSGNDHRLFMALCIGAMRVGNCAVSDPGSVSVSYPGFMQDMTMLGARFDEG